MRVLFLALLSAASSSALLTVPSTLLAEGILLMCSSPATAQALRLAQLSG